MPMSTIIMIHGFGACSTQWKFLSDHLIVDHLTIHSIDLLGHGNGGKSSIRTDYSIESTFEKMIFDIDSIADDEIILIGHSLGGYLSLMCAHQFPERIKNLVLINPLFTREQVGPGLKIMNQLGKIFYISKDHFPNRLVKFGHELSKITH
ncbi:MAG: alpha/beta fold hydrolase, partial [candidate division Zixibacteria bacterium]|nr:alpha/beta hydrolase [candidate division Zixibacteria bacterium]NIW44952.1 alpha/beta fold hydrolase [Gammaproteobacteria bacterium]NIR64112.1 alpha/beta hydrolase [candidate division Zixibacteria bacterium]NIS46012.1 alpha/beta hydrolase [candidate division Zixibacteria bacterium]NIU14135.1 alpha/beta hydrolase [candidate division Zixibacteria bacterium]